MRCPWVRTCGGAFRRRFDEDVAARSRRRRVVISCGRSRRIRSASPPRNPANGFDVRPAAARRRRRRRDRRGRHSGRRHVRRHGRGLGRRRGRRGFGRRRAGGAAGGHLGRLVGRLCRRGLGSLAGPQSWLHRRAAAAAIDVAGRAHDRKLVLVPVRAIAPHCIVRAGRARARLRARDAGAARGRATTQEGPAPATCAGLDRISTSQPRRRRNSSENIRAANDVWMHESDLCRNHPYEAHPAGPATAPRHRRDRPATPA